MKDREILIFAIGCIAGVAIAIAAAAKYIHQVEDGFNEAYDSGYKIGFSEAAQYYQETYGIEETIIID